MNFLTVGARINKKLDQAKRDAEAPWSNLGQQPPDGVVEAYQKMVWDQYERDVRTGLTAMQKFKEIAAEMGYINGRWWWITISPPDGNFDAFYNAVRGLLERKCFLEYTCSFEQRGTSEEDLGKGYHCHIAVSVKQRSKGELKRDVESTFAKLAYKIADNFIDYKPTKNPGEMVQKYLLDYESKDGHKAATKEWDARWRDKMGLDDLYKDSLPAVRVRSGPTIVELE